MIQFALILASSCVASAISQPMVDKTVLRDSAATIPCDLLIGADGSNINIQKIAWFKERNMQPIYG